MMKNEKMHTLSSRWSRTVPPARPSMRELKAYQDQIQNLKNVLNRKPKCLIMGSTPEFRDLAFVENLDVTVIGKKQEPRSCIRIQENKTLGMGELIENEQETTESQKNKTIDSMEDISPIFTLMLEVQDT